MVENLVIDSENMNSVSTSTVYEENNGDIVVAKIPSMTLTPKRISVKCHWFKQHVGK